MIAEAVAERAVGNGLLPNLAVEFRGFFHGRSGDPDGAGKRRADEEGDPPAPARKVRLANRGDGQRGDSDSEERSDFACGRGGGGDEAAPMRFGAFQQIGDDAGIFPADREPHHAAEQDEQDARGRADLRVGREQGGCEHGRRHQCDGEQQHVPPALAVADMPEEDRPERPHQIGDREPAERDQQRRLSGSEEDAGEDGREVEIEGEIVPFDDRREGGDRQRRAGDRSMRMVSVDRRHKVTPLPDRN
jgi:hypothetical protein